MNAKLAVRSFLRRRGVEVSGYRWTVTAQRQKIFDYYGIDLLVDVGANVGQYAKAARRAGYGGTLVSIEPLGSAFEQLQSAAADDPQWEVVRSAVGATAGSLTLHVSKGSIFSSALRILDNAVAADGNAKQIGDEEVSLVTLDEVLAGRDYAGLAVKIDVQGFERDVLDGAERSLSVAKVVEMELSPRPVYEGQMLMEESLRRMADAGFVLSLSENLLRDQVSGRCLQFNGIFTRAD